MADKCPNCGAPLENNVCPYCGYKVEVAPEKTININYQEQTSVYLNENIKLNELLDKGVIPGESKKNKTVALLLCIFLGYLGIHRFYVGKIGTGLLYFFTCGLFLVGWIADIISIALGRFKDNFDLPLR